VTDYEILLMLDPELADERQSEIVSRVREQIERSGGSWQGHDAWGQRRLAYEIAHKNEGSYHLLTFAAEPEAVAEVSRVLKITDGVMRHMAVRQPAAPPPRPGGPVETGVERRQDSDEQPSPVA
jgi:small subunit ribosomal protein S6